MAIFLTLFTLLLIGFATVQMFKGNLEGAFMPLPFLLILYFYLRPTGR